MQSWDMLDMQDVKPYENKQCETTNLAEDLFPSHTTPAPPPPPPPPKTKNQKKKPKKKKEKRLAEDYASPVDLKHKGFHLCTSSEMNLQALLHSQLH